MDSAKATASVSITGARYNRLDSHYVVHFILQVSADSMYAEV